MSAYATVKTQFVDRNCLVAALQKMYGENGKHIIVSDEPLSLYGYEHRERAERANVILPGSGRPKCTNIVGAASNDLGFVLVDGQYQAIISSYDSRKHDEKWLGQLKAHYAEAKIHANAKKHGVIVTTKIVGEEVVMQLKQYV